MASPNYRAAAGRGNASHGGPGNRNSAYLGGGGRGGGGGGPRGGGPGPGSRWGNGPPSSTSSPANNRNSPAARHGHPGNNMRHNPAGQPQNQQQHHQAASNNAPAFPSLAGGANSDGTQKLMHDRMLFLLVSLVGNPVIVHVRGGKRYFGILSSANTESGDLGVALASAQEVTGGTAEGDKLVLGALKRMLVIHGRELESVEASDIRIAEQEKQMKEAREKEAFRTDTEISRTFDPLGQGRTLQKWSEDPDLADLDGDVPEWAEDTATTFDGGAGGGGKGWDQFAANEARFGIKSDYEETLYTTKLDRSGKDFKEKEKQAERLAREIMSQSTTNSHMAEERGQGDDSGINEEDKYGAVVRGPNAYIPPALRKAAAAAAATKGDASTVTAAANTAGAAANAKVNGANVAGQAAAPTPNAAQTAATAGSDSKSAQAAIPPPPAVNVKAPSPSLPHQEQAKAGAVSPESAKKLQDAANPLMGDFRQFVSSERERLEKKKAALAKKEKDTRLADLKTWASTFRLKTPAPNDASGNAQQDKAVSDKPRDVNLQKSLSPQAPHASAAGSQSGTTPAASADTSKLPLLKASGPTASLSTTPTGGAGSAAATSNAKAANKLAETKAMLANMTIPKIPPYNPERAKARQAEITAGKGSEPGAAEAAKAESKPTEPTGITASTSAFKLSAKASAFKPFNPNATAFTPGGSAAAAGKKPDSAAPSPAISAASASASVSTNPTAPANKFFGNRVLQKPSTNTAIHVREDFNPFKVSKVPDAKSVGPMWAFSGKPYRQHFVLAGPQGQLDDGSEAMYMQGMPGPGVPLHGAPQPSQGVPHQAHAAQGQPPHVPVSGPPGAPGVPGQQQPYGMVYQPYGPYRLHNQPQPHGPPQPGQHAMVQPMQMPPNGQGAPVPYGAMPPQFMGQMPFSPPMPPHATANQGLYSPQMANMPPPGQQFIPGGPGGSGAPHNVGPPGPQGNQGQPVRPPPPHMQQKGGHPPQMYYHQPQPGPMGAMPYPPQFAMQPGPGPGPGPAGRPVGPPPMAGSGGRGSEASSTVGLPPTGLGGPNEPPSH